MQTQTEHKLSYVVAHKPLNPSFITERERICNLDVVSFEGADMNPALKRETQNCCDVHKKDKSGWHAACTYCNPSLNELQSQMLYAAQYANGLLAFAGTGSGKAWVANLLPHVMHNVSRALIFAPSSTLSNLQSERSYLMGHFLMPRSAPVSFHSYESLSRATKEGGLDYIEEKILENDGNPDTTLLVFDEAHSLRNCDSARGARVLRCVSKYQKIRICALSGSMTNNSVKDFAHIAWMALKTQSPCPSPRGAAFAAWDATRDTTLATTARIDAEQTLKSWANVLDKDGEATGPDWLSFQPLFSWAEGGRLNMADYIGQERVTLCRRAFQYRLSTAPGVIMSRNTSLENTALIVHGSYPDLPEVIANALCGVDGGEDPEGNPLPDASARWNVKRQIAQGFYYVCDWPVDVAGVPIVDKDWLLARNSWHKSVRWEIKSKQDTGYDSSLLIYSSVARRVRQSFARSPLQLAYLKFISRSHKNTKTNDVAAANREELATWIAAGGDDYGPVFEECENYFASCIRKHKGEDTNLMLTWLNWSSRQKHKREPPKKAIWLSEYLFDHIDEFVAMQKAEGFEVILWYNYQEVGRKLQQRGYPIFGAGTEPPKTAVTCGLAIDTHDEGKNLQAWSRQYMICPSAGSTQWEQALSRTHRTGQLADVVRCWVSMHLQEFREALLSARKGADYAQAMLSNPQKLLHATFQDIKLPTVGEEKLRERFGDVNSEEVDEPEETFAP